MQKGIYEKWEIAAGIPYTPESRLIQLAEECGELIQACMKLLRKDCGVDRGKASENLLEEIADVEIVLGQVRNLLPPGKTNDIKQVKIAKLSREQQRLRTENELGELHEKEQ